MSIELKRRLAFTLLMGIVTTGVISFALLGFNRGFAQGFLWLWFRSWLISYAIVIPAITLIGPRLQAQVNRLIK